MVRGCSILSFEDSYKFTEFINHLKKNFDFLPRLYFPNIIEREKLHSFNLANHELFELSNTSNLVLAPEYSSMFLEDASKNFNAGYYIQSCFRKERPQSNRKRQFYQFGVETHVDKHIEFFLLEKLLKSLENIPNFTIEFNNQGTVEERELFLANLPNLLKKEKICLNCSYRLEKRNKFNLFKILECDCNQSILYLDDYIKKQPLDLIISNFIASHSNLSINKKLFRGIDYYDGWTFNIISKNIIIGGGGYYAKKYFGFALGINRILQILPNRLIYDLYWLEEINKIDNFLEQKPDEFKICLHLKKPQKILHRPSIIVTKKYIYLIKDQTKKIINQFKDLWT